MDSGETERGMDHDVQKGGVKWRKAKNGPRCFVRNEFYLKVNHTRVINDSITTTLWIELGRYDGESRGQQEWRGAKEGQKLIALVRSTHLYFHLKHWLIVISPFRGSRIIKNVVLDEIKDEGRKERG